MDRLNRIFQNGGMGVNSAPPGAVSEPRFALLAPGAVVELRVLMVSNAGVVAFDKVYILTGFLDQDSNLIDNSETVYISSLALLKMLRHGRAGVPMEVMGLMLGEFVDDYTVRVVDVFAMPQSGTGVSVEAVDPVFQTKMMDMLRQTGRFV